MAKFVVASLNREVVLGEDETIMQGAEREGLIEHTRCGGHGSCAACKVRILKGKENLSPMGYTETARLGTTFNITGERLACQTYLSGDVVLELMGDEGRDKTVRGRQRALSRARELAQRTAARNEQKQRSQNGRR